MIKKNTTKDNSKTTVIITTTVYFLGIQLYKKVFKEVIPTSQV